MKNDAVRAGMRPDPGSSAWTAAPHALAAETGAAVLRRGGSAADAAIAMNAVLAVVYPHMAGLGGDGFWLVWEPGAGAAASGAGSASAEDVAAARREAARRSAGESLGRAVGINASGPAAALASPGWYRERGLESIPERGPLAALTVPGAVDGWRLAHERWGRLPWSELFTDAVRLARTGVPVAGSLARYARADAADLGAHPEAARLFAPALTAGRTDQSLALEQPELARSLERLAEAGARAGFYEGGIGEEIGRALAAAGSPLRGADLASYRAEWVEPLRGTYRGHELLELPPNTQGIAAIQILRLLEGFDVAAWGDDSADYIHAVVEATKLAFADRDAWVADPRFLEAPLARLASAEYADARRALIERERALAPGSVLPGIAPGQATRPGGIAGRSAGGAANPGSGRQGDTCYFCAVDERGLAVSCIQSLYFAFGSMVPAGDTGILLHDRGTGFSFDPGAANRLEPGKKPFHTLIPAMLLREGQPRLLFGSMGGDGQPQTQAALVTRVVDFGYPAQQAVNAPRWLFGRTWGEPTRALSLESRIPAATARELARRGHEVRALGPWDETVGHAQILLRRADGSWQGAADPRGDGAAVRA